MPIRLARLALPILAATLALGGQPAAADQRGCPPGLAKKAVPCVPPGLAKKGVRSFSRGDRIHDRDYHLIRYPDRYGLDPLSPGERYYVVDGQILRVSEETYEVLDVVRAVSALLD